MKRIFYKVLFLISGTVLLSGCAMTEVPVVGNMTPTPTPTEAVAVTETPTETPIPIITTTPEDLTPVPVSLTPIAEADDYLKTIGSKAQGETVLKVKFVNNTGKDITGVRVIPMLALERDGTTDAVNLLAEGDPYKDREERVFYYNTALDEPSEDGLKHYNMELTFSDNTAYTMTDVPFSNMKEGSIRISGEVAYIDYLPVTGQGRVSLLADEAAAEAARKLAAEEEASHKDEDEDEGDPYDEEW